MSRVITFSRQFQKAHPRHGDNTFFVEKVVRGLLLLSHAIEDIDECFFDEQVYETCEPKYHTIRAGNRWKVGDKFSPRVWSGKPYASKQIIIAPDVEIKKIWLFEVNLISRPNYQINGVGISNSVVDTIAKNDGLSVEDFRSWFWKPPLWSAGFFTGQIIGWNENIKY